MEFFKESPMQQEPTVPLPSTICHLWHAGLHKVVISGDERLSDAEFDPLGVDNGVEFQLKHLAIINCLNVSL